MNKQSGFTIIELVIVVVILGFLAVTAIPKFLDLTDQAKQANIEGMAGGFATGVSLARAQWEAEGRPENVGGVNSVNYDGTQVILTSESADIRPGYIVGLTDGESLDGNFDVANCIEVWESLLQQPPNITSDEAVLNDQDEKMRYFASKSGGDDSTLCHYHLKESLNKDADGFVAPAANALTTTGNSFTYQPANSSVIVYIN